MMSWLRSYDEMTPDQQFAYRMGRADALDGPTDEMVERGRFPILDTTAMFASKMLGITHEEAMEREDIQRMASIVARAVLEAALMTKGG